MSPNIRFYIQITTRTLNTTIKWKKTVTTRSGRYEYEYEYEYNLVLAIFSHPPCSANYYVHKISSI